MKLKNCSLFIIIFVTSIFILSCSANRNKETKELIISATPQSSEIYLDSIGDLKNEMVTDVAKTKIIEIDYLNLDGAILNSAYDIKIIPLETNKQSMLGEIQKILFDGKNYYIMNGGSDSRLVKFDANGKFVSDIGSRGKGFGEYIQIYDFALTSDEVVVLDGLGRKMIFYDLNGKYKASADLKVITREIYSTSNPDEFILAVGDNRHIKDLYGYKLLKVARNGKILSKALKYTTEIPFCAPVNGQYNNGKTTYHSSLSNLIHEISNDTISVKYQFDFKNANLPKNFKEVCNGDFEKFCEIYRGKYRYLTGMFATNENHLILSFTLEHNINILYIHNLNSGESLAISPGIMYGGSEFDINGLIGYIMMTGISVYNDEFIATASPNILLNLSKYPLQQKKYMGEVKEIEYDTNPYIVKFKLK